MADKAYWRDIGVTKATFEGGSLHPLANATLYFIWKK